MTPIEERKLSEKLAQAISYSFDVAKFADAIKEKIEVPPSGQGLPQPPPPGLFGQADYLISILAGALAVLEWANRQL